jgi:hypothetical protein
VRELVPITLTDLKRYVNENHAHNEAPTSWKFGVGLAEDGVLVGVCAVGRPQGRGLDQYLDVEVTRVCVAEKGMHRNACSTLYGAACRAAAALGYRTAYTYTLEEEDAASVRAAGFVLDAVLQKRSSDWGSSRPRYSETLFGPRRIPTDAKVRWRRDLKARAVTPA